MLQVSAHSGPRNQLNLPNKSGRPIIRAAVLLFGGKQLVPHGAVPVGRSFFVSGKREDAGEIAIEVDFQLPLIIRGEGDPFHEGAQQIGGLGAVLLRLSACARLAA